MINIKRTAISRYEENKKNYSGLIQTSIRESEIYEEKRNYYSSAFHNTNTAGCVLVSADTVSAACSINGGRKLCVLNFASFTNPGGGFIDVNDSNRHKRRCRRTEFYAKNGRRSDPRKKKNLR